MNPVVSYLRRKCPANIWMQERFELSLQMVSGHHIVLRYDLKSSGYEGVRLSPQQIISAYGAGILGDNKLEVAAAISDTIADRTRLTWIDHTSVCVMSSYLLDALDVQDYECARKLGLDMVDTLEPYRPRADEVWGEWLLIVSDFVNGETGPDYPEIGLML